MIGSSANTLSERTALGIKLNEIKEPSGFFFSVWMFVMVNVWANSKSMFASAMSDTLMGGWGSKILFKFEGRSL